MNAAVVKNLHKNWAPTEMEALCGSIFMTQKFNKSVRKMRVSLEEVEESRRVQMTKKVEEKRELMAGLS